jgi:hypothetical protein
MSQNMLVEAAFLASTFFGRISRNWGESKGVILGRQILSTSTLTCYLNNSIGV